MSCIGVISPLYLLTIGQVVGNAVRIYTVAKHRRDSMITAKEIARIVRLSTSQEDVIRTVDNYLDRVQVIVKEYVQRHPGVTHDYSAIAVAIWGISAEKREIKIGDVLCLEGNLDEQSSRNLDDSAIPCSTDSKGFAVQVIRELIRRDFQVVCERRNVKGSVVPVVIPWIFLSESCYANDDEDWT